jgi:hypothetical protein
MNVEIGIDAAQLPFWEYFSPFSVQYLCSVSEMIKSNRNDVLLYFIQIFWENVHVLIAMSLIVLLATLIVFIKVLYRNTRRRYLVWKLRKSIILVGFGRAHPSF